MLADYHVHTPYCGHAKGRTIEFVERAVELGIDEIGFADHLGRYYLTAAQKKRYWDWGMDTRKLERYAEELEKLRALFAGTIVIRTGLEIDYVEGAEDLLDPLLARFPIDFALASVHCLPRFGWHHLTRYARKPPEDLYREYFRCAEAAAETGLFQSLAHLDFVWRYVPWPEHIGGELLDHIADVVLAASQSRMAMEINVNGYLWSTLSREEEDDPFGVMLEEIARLDVPVTTGSDAHTPAAVGASFEEMIAHLARKGITHCQTFKEGRPKRRKMG
jgi:histidinol-phosphatase (PHP family)